MTTQKIWFAVPPYEDFKQWIIVNDKGELVATFESKDECILAAESVNKRLENYEVEEMEDIKRQLELLTQKFK